MRPRRARTMIVAVVVLTLAACGEDRGPDADGPTDAPAAPALERMFDGLEEDYGCGHGFYASDSEQSRGLFIFAADPQTSEAELGIPGEVALPDDRWLAYVETGEDLFANWCDDVVVPDDPEPVTEASYTITGGTMTVTPAGADGGSDGSSDAGPDAFTAELTDIEVEGPDGSVVELGGLTTTNELWGVYAG